MKRYKSIFNEGGRQIGIGLPGNVYKGKTIQTTLDIDGQKVKIKSVPKSYYGNFGGWTVFIDNKKYFCNVTDREEAIDKCVEKYKKSIV